MKPSYKKTVVLFWVFAAMAGILIGVDLADASDGTDTWRKVYDLILKWINFGILVFLILKFLRTPFKNFIAGKQIELERKIGRLEEEKSEAEKKIQEILQAVDLSQSEFDVLKQKIIEQGEIKKQAIIEDARQKSRVMLDQTQLRIENRIHHYRKQLRDELVDAAFELALEKLPKIVTADDNRILIQDYIAGAVGKQAS